MGANRKKLVSVAVIGGIVLVAAVILALRLGGDKPGEQRDTSAGVSYIQELEAKSPETVEQILKQQREEKLSAMRDQRLRELESGEISVWTLFEDYVILGDSRAVGFYYFGFLPENRVLAEGGATIRDLKEHIPQVVELNPANIFLCYGLNDVSIGYWETPEEYTAEFRQTLLELQSQLPEATIYISSILPARDPAFETASIWREIPTFSAAVRDMCETLDRCYYVDNDAIAEQYADLWDPVDGVHVGKDFYDHWAANLIAEVYNAGLRSEMEDT